MTRQLEPLNLAETRAALQRELRATERDQLWARIDAQIPLERNTRSSLLSGLRLEAPWSRWVWAFGSAFVVLNIWFGYENFFKDRGALMLEDGQALGTVSTELAPRHLRFSDESSIALRPQTQLTALAMTDDQVLLRLERGSAQFHVKKGGHRRWRIESGLLAVEVIGTRFTVNRSRASVEVTVSEGRVLVRSPALNDGVMRLDAGQEVTVHAPQTAAEQARRESSTLPQPPPAQAPESLPSTSSADGRASSSEPPPSGERPSLRGLLAEADQARAAGDTKRAVSLLRSIVQLYPADPQAALSSFALGRLHQREGQWAAADAAYGWALRHGASGSLREDCYLRRIEVQLHSDKRLAERSAHEYLTHYPQGRHRTVIEHMLQPSAAPSARDDK